MSEPLVIVGNGMATMRLVETLTQRALGRYAVAVVGEEPRLAYNRVLLSSVLAQEVSRLEIELRSAGWWRDHGAGIRPNIDLARTADLAVDRGIVVDDHLQASKAGIYAIGECAEHRGICYGLVEPAYDQARALAAQLAGEVGIYGGSVLATNLKVSGVNVFSAGHFLGAPVTEQIVFSDPGLGSYKKLVIAGGRLAGVIMFGDTADGLWYLDLIRSAASIEAFRDDLVFGPALAERRAA